MCDLRDAPDAIEGAWLGVYDPWLLFCLYIPGTEVGIKCIEPAVEWAHCLSSLHADVYAGVLEKAVAILMRLTG